MAYNRLAVIADKPIAFYNKNIKANFAELFKG